MFGARLHFTLLPPVRLLLNATTRGLTPHAHVAQPGSAGTSPTPFMVGVERCGLLVDDVGEYMPGCVLRRPVPVPGNPDPMAMSEVLVVDHGALLAECLGVFRSLDQHASAVLRCVSVGILAVASVKTSWHSVFHFLVHV